MAGMNDLLLRALARRGTGRTPVWFMRQAGRCLPRYREIRERRGFLDIVPSRITPEHIDESRDVFPLEFLDLRFAHVTVYGEA